MKKQRKIYYVGGMISLIFIPIIFLNLAKPTLDKLNLRVIDIGLPYKVKKGEKGTDYSTIPIDGYNYQMINIPNNFDEKTEKEYFNKIKKIQKQNIDKTGIKFQLSANNNFNDIVRLINLMLKTEQDFWGLDTERTDAFYVVHRKFEYSNDDDFVLCGGVIFDYIDQNDYYFKHLNFFHKVVKHSPKESYYLIFGFLILVYVSVCRMLRFNRNKSHKKGLVITN